MKAKRNIQKLVYTGMLVTVAGALMSLEFSIPMMLPFYKIDLSGTPSIIVLLLMGSTLVAWAEIIRIIIKLVTIDTNSMYIGKFVSLIGIALFIIPMWVAYKKGGKIRRIAIASLAISAPIRTLLACFCSIFIALPLYAAVTGLPLNQAIIMMVTVNPAISDLTTFIFLATIPLSLIKLGPNYFMGYLLYTRLLTVYPAVRTA